MKELTEKELLRRIALDFTKNEEQIRQELSDYFPELSDSQMRKWEASGALESVEINGERRYFRNAARNLLRIDAKGRELLLAREGEERAERAQMLARYIPALVNGEIPKTKKYQVTYRLTVKADAVPAGELLRCWLPYPRTDEKRQVAVHLLHCNVKNSQILSQGVPHASLYAEQKAVAGKDTLFQVCYAFTSVAEFLKEIPSSVNQFVKVGFEDFLCERLPHIAFSDALRELAYTIVGDNDSPYHSALLIFQWIRKQLPWASAREYSTLKNIPEYVMQYGHGDCGQVSLLFITLCRIVGVPARWQSGFMLHPGFENLHDWTEIYLQGLGWVPVDVSFGPQKRLDSEKERNFYFGGMDAFRWIVNSDYAGELVPTKEYERSEPIDFQRGEVEWGGGNLYFDSWDYEFLVEHLEE